MPSEELREYATLKSEQFGERHDVGKLARECLRLLAENARLRSIAAYDPSDFGPDGPLKVTEEWLRSVLDEPVHPHATGIYFTRGKIEVWRHHEGGFWAVVCGAKYDRGMRIQYRHEVRRLVAALGGTLAGTEGGENDPD